MQERAFIACRERRHGLASLRVCRRGLAIHLPQRGSTADDDGGRERGDGDGSAGQFHRPGGNERRQVHQDHGVWILGGDEDAAVVAVDRHGDDAARNGGLAQSGCRGIHDLEPVLAGLSHGHPGIAAISGDQITGAGERGALAGDSTVDGGKD